MSARSARCAAELACGYLFIKVCEDRCFLLRYCRYPNMKLSEGNALLKAMLEAGFRSHSDDLGPEVSRLENKRGQR